MNWIEPNKYLRIIMIWFRAVPSWLYSLVVGWRGVCATAGYSGPYCRSFVWPTNIGEWRKNNWQDRNKAIGKELLQCHFIHHTSHTKYPCKWSRVSAAGTPEFWTAPIVTSTSIRRRCLHPAVSESDTRNLQSVNNNTCHRVVKQRCYWRLFTSAPNRRKR